jgi:tRNA threonylcarbamoyladenosine biosynthesis protein TsaB
MKLLAIDTSSLACTAGVLVDGQMLGRYEEEERAHTRLLMPMIRSLLAEAELRIQDLDALVLGNGPGSFIGMRIAASVTAGMAKAADLPVVPVSSLAAVAADTGDVGDSVLVAQDAHMREVYLGFYRRGQGGLVSPLYPERLQPLTKVEELDSASFIAAGSGWQRYPELLAVNRPMLAALSERRYPTAEALLRLGAAGYEAGQKLPAEKIVPAYLRDTVAQPPEGSRP